METPLQKTVISYGRQAVIAGIIFTIIFLLVGVGLTIWASLEPDITESERDFRFLLYACGIGFIVMSFLCLPSILFGVKLKAAAVERDLGRLQTIYLIWIVMDVFAGVLTLLLLVLFQKLELLLVVIGLCIDLWRLRVMSRFMAEVKCGPGLNYQEENTQF